MNSKPTPAIISFEILKPQDTMRFAIKLHFDNGEVKVYSIPDAPPSSEQPVVYIDYYVFTDKIFANAYLQDNALCFINGLTIPVEDLYEYSQPL